MDSVCNFVEVILLVSIAQLAPLIMRYAVPKDVAETRRIPVFQFDNTRGLGDRFFPFRRRRLGGVTTAFCGGS